MATTIQARPQVGIERLPSSSAHRIGSEQREAMNCKSCRKRKIKCNRLRPKCEACKIFQCACLYDAVPKKRGPKTEVLESLLKRVDELEKKLPNEKKSGASASASSKKGSTAAAAAASTTAPAAPPPLNTSMDTSNATPLYSPLSQSGSASSDVFIDAYFLRIHDKPFHILDEITVRKQHQVGQLPMCLRLAIYAVSARLVSQTSGYNAAVRLSEEYAIQARAQIDVDEPSIVALQSLLLVQRAFFAAGKGRKAYMLLSMAINMCLALDLHRELPSKVKVSPDERDLRRQLYWTCYLLDRFSASGSKRPSLLSNDSIILRFPSWVPYPGALPVEGEYFSANMNFQHHPDTGSIVQGSIVMLIDIARILGITNKYLANGGVKGDTHFPWHSSSALSKIRHELDYWASGNQDLFMDLDGLFARSDNVILFLSKLLYHVIHCLVYRPFLPVDLAELQGSGQHQSWQIEATHLCFLHANAVAEATAVARQITSMEWPAFVGYCLATAGTVHVHGVHYKGHDGELFLRSAEYLSQEMQMLSELRYQWASVQHQKDTLQNIYVCHSDLVKSLASNPLRFSPVFHLEDFFDRYPGRFFDGAHITFSNAVVDAVHESMNSQTRERVQSISDAQMMHQNTIHVDSGVMHQQPPARGYTDSALSPPILNDRQSQMAAVATSPLTQETDFGQFPSVPELSSGLSSGFSTNFPFSPATTNSTFEQPLYPFSAGATDPSTATTSVKSDIDLHAFNAGLQQTALTPEGTSHTSSTHAGEDKDSFLTILEQLAENEQSRGGPSDLDYYLGDQAS